MSLYLDVLFEEKDEAKALGARWNPEIKLWYVDMQPDEYVKFAKWIIKDTAKDKVKDIDSIAIARNNLYVIEGIQNCYYCGNPTRVIGLGMGEFIELYWGEKNKCQYAQFTDTYGKRIYLMWMQREENIPPKLLKYLKENYSVRTGYSQARKEYCFANHCDHCGKIQGNKYVFEETESPLIPHVLSGKDELKEKISKLTVKKISLKDDLRLVCDLYIDSTRYLKYGRVEELDLSTDPNNKGVTYEELYGWKK